MNCETLLCSRKIFSLWIMADGQLKDLQLWWIDWMHNKRNMENDPYPSNPCDWHWPIETMMATIMINYGDFKKKLWAIIITGILMLKFNAVPNASSSRRPSRYTQQPQSYQSIVVTTTNHLCHFFRTISIVQSGPKYFTFLFSFLISTLRKKYTPTIPTTFQSNHNQFLSRPSTPIAIIQLIS